MSRLNDLLRELRTREPALAADLEREVAALADRRAFGLNFERHVPEAVELPGRKVRKGDKVRVLPPRGQAPRKSDEKLWRVVRLDRSRDEAALVELVASPSEPVLGATAEIAHRGATRTAALGDLVVVAEFRDSIYPGLVSTGRVHRGGANPFHTVINAENFLALQALLFTHRAKVDCIYIDPPYNTGAKDWKYNNDYVETDDLYRHSKWLAFMERRLHLAKELLDPEDSTLIVMIDEKEVHRLGLLLEQVFVGCRIQMISIWNNPKGAHRAREFARTNEYAFFVFIGDAAVPVITEGSEPKEVRWPYLRRSERTSVRSARPNQFYAIYVESRTGRIVSLGEPLRPEDPLDRYPTPAGTVPVFPIADDGVHKMWSLTPPSLQRAIDGGFVRVTPGRNEHQPFTIAYFTAPAQAKVDSGEYVVVGTRDDGSKIVVNPRGKAVHPTTAWHEKAHDAGAHGTSMLKMFIPGRPFPFPKSLYAVEECLRIAVTDKPNAVILDFFAGSGTTAHATMRLNKQDGGRRVSISVTNNEVSAEEQSGLREAGLRPGDADWEKWGICEYVTKPRIAAAITGMTPDGTPVEGEYKFTDEFRMADGFEESVEFLTLTFEAPLRVASNRAFGKIALLLWMRSGSQGRCIEDLSSGWDVADVYGVLANLDLTTQFVEAVRDREGVKLAFVVTDEDRLFESVAQQLPDRVEAVRLYQAYLRNFEIETGRGAL